MARRSKKAPKGCVKVGKYYHCRLQSKAKFDPRSFRMIKRGKILLRIGCPKGKYDKRKRRCKVGTRAQAKLIPV